MTEGQIIRIDGRTADQLRPVTITPDFLPNAEGSALIEIGDTKVICAATLEQRVPFHAKQGNHGWLTAEYAMLPRATARRTMRDGKTGRVNPRSQEIQRMIGRLLRAVVDLNKLVERTIIIDCDVLQADGGTRTAAITGAYTALALALRRLQSEGKVAADILHTQLAAISVGIVEGRPVLDLCYLEDSQAEVDMNVVMTADGRLVELQATAEAEPFTLEQHEQLLALARQGVNELVAVQQSVLEPAIVDITLDNNSVPQ